MKHALIPKRKLRLDAGWIGSLRECAGQEAEVYLDTLTGRAVVIPDCVFRAADADGDVALAPDERDDVPLAEAILRDGSGRYLSIPGITSAARYTWMTEFAAGVVDPDLYLRLDAALDLEGTFARFDEALAGFRAERHAWFQFRRRRLERDTATRLAALGLEPVGGL